MRILEPDKINRELFEDKIRQETSCWTWTAGTGSDGYGRFSVDRQPHAAHRVAYTLWIGRIPDGFAVYQKCRNRLCVNPSHLKAVTQMDIVRAGKRAEPQNKTHCPKGHELTEENKYVRPNPQNRNSYYYCRACAREYWNEHGKLKRRQRHAPERTI